MLRASKMIIVLVGLGGFGSLALAEDIPPAGGDAPAAAGEAPGDEAPTGEAAEDGEVELSERELWVALRKQLDAVDGPKQGVAIGELATIDVPEGYWLVPAAGMTRFDQMMENIHDPDGVGALVKMSPDGGMDYALYFSFEAIGYVKDDDRDLDADELLASLRDGARSSNQQRKAQGYPEIEIVGWSKQPFYNPDTQSLEWGTIFRQKDAPQGDTGTVNYNTRRLGRDGVMSLVLAADPEGIEGSIADMNVALRTFAYLPGKDYASFKEGDRIAEIGLGALVVGGGAAVLMKVGFFKKFWKLLALIGAGIVGFFAKLFRRKEKPSEVVAGDGLDAD